MCLLILCSLLVSAHAQQATNKLAIKKPAPAGTLSDEQIAGLKTEWKDDKGKTFTFNGSLSVNLGLDKSKLEKFRKSGKVPVRVLCSFYEMKVDNGKTLSKRIDTGDAKFYVMDFEGTIIFKESESLAKMCPS